MKTLSQSRGINEGQVTLMALLYLALPSILFFLGWLTPIPAILASLGVIGSLIYYAVRLMPKERECILPFNRRTISVVAAAFFLICLLHISTGLIGFFLTDPDYELARQAYYVNLIEAPWPIVLPNGCEINYYIAAYLPPAILARIFAAYPTEGSTLAQVILLLWTALGYTLAFLVVFTFRRKVSLIFVFFVEINQIIVQLQQEEQKKIELWANAVSRKARFVEHTTAFFNKAAQEEQLRLQQFVKAHQIILSQPLDAELNFYYDFIVNNKNIPVIITDEFNNIQLSQNVDIPEGQKVLVGSLLKRFSQNPPFEYNVSGMKFKLYYSESSVYTNLKETLKYFTTTFLDDLVNNSVLIPVVITDSTESIVIASGNIAKKDIRGDKLKNTINEMKNENGVWTINLPEFPNARIFYKHSHFITALQYYPMIFILITIFFVFLIFRLFKAMKKTEETALWIGMNKETAHQLGTPISALVAWVEYLRLKPENKEVCNEITKDINRLNMITQRFSQIGTNPELLPQNIIPVVQNAMAYLSSRSSKKVNFVLNLPQDTEIILPINQCLIEWTLENLSKNAIDAMGGIGTLTLDLTQDSKRVFIDVSDTGKGMPKKQFKKVFEAGFTTKERGWGMGLSLAKRIIEEYHHGKIFVKQSTINRGTTFRIVLKKEE